MEWDAKCSDTFWNVSLQKQGLLLSLLVIKVYLPICFILFLTLSPNNGLC